MSYQGLYFATIAVAEPKNSCEVDVAYVGVGSGADIEGGGVAAQRTRSRN